MRSINDFPMFSLSTLLDATYDVDLLVAGEYYSIHDAVSHIIKKMKYFTGVDGLLTYISTQPHSLHLIGDTSISVDKAATVKFTLFKSGVPYVTTKLGFVSPTKIGSMGVNDIIDLIENNTLEIKASSNVDNTTLTISSLQFSMK